MVSWEKRENESIRAVMEGEMNSTGERLTYLVRGPVT